MKKIIFIIIILLLYNPFDNFAQGWFQQNSGVNFNLNSVYFVDASTGYAVGDSGAAYIIKTTNGGASWQRQTALQGFHQPLKSIHFLNANTGWIGGGNSPSGYILKTINGGMSWALYYVQASPSPSLYSIRFINDLTGIAVGSTYSTASTIFRSTNGGVNWNSQGISGSNILYSVYFVDALTGYACGEPGTIIKTTNAGVSWVTQTSGTTAILKSIYFINQSIGWVAGSDSRVYKTTNGGIDWFMYYNQSLCGLNSVYFTNEQTGWVCGCEGAINSTTNYGNNWMLQSFASTTYLNSMSFISHTTGWAVGAGGRILKTITGGITGIEPVSNQIADKFSLSQNYPNPFNPSTVINFNVSKAGIISIHLYDNLGKEIQTLTNEFYNGGSHQINFNAENLTAGIYYYKLTANGYTETRKMVLVK